MRQISRRMEMIHTTIFWRRDEHGTHKDVCITCSRENILCPAWRHGYLTLLYVTSIQDFFCPLNNGDASQSQPRVFARLLVGKNA